MFAPQLYLPAVRRIGMATASAYGGAIRNSAVREQSLRGAGGPNANRMEHRGCREKQRLDQPVRRYCEYNGGSSRRRFDEEMFAVYGVKYIDASALAGKKWARDAN
jgi:hypothetical protein